MARPSKSQHFTIYEDTGIPTPGVDDEGYQPSFDDGIAALEKNRGRCCEEEEEELSGSGGEDADDEARKTSGTSISSLPESAWQTDGERRPKLSSPPVIRPSFRRPESVRRMQLSSPAPSSLSFGSRSPRHSMVRNSRAGTPGSLRSAGGRGSPRPRRRGRRGSEETAELEEDGGREGKEYPLVLLHITLLPVRLRWREEVLREVLPEAVWDSLSLLRGKVTDLVIQRGLLISHPGEEYELLEERLLEALELRGERVTKCGHFRVNTRESTGSVDTSGSGSDSGLGSSLDSLVSEEDVCETCHRHPVYGSKTSSGSGRRWNITVYAANGLMRASAWAAAWSEMERVDVEILPWIGEEMVRKLDARVEGEKAASLRGSEQEDESVTELMGREGMLTQESLRRREAEQRAAMAEAPVRASASAASAQPANVTRMKDDLPQVYPPSQIPLSMLLKNYFFLLAQDRRNVAIFFLVIVAAWFGLHSFDRSEMIRLDLAATGLDGQSVGPLGDMPTLVRQVGEVEFDVVGGEVNETAEEGVEFDEDGQVGVKDEEVMSLGDGTEEREVEQDESQYDANDIPSTSVVEADSIDAVSTASTAATHDPSDPEAETPELVAALEDNAYMDFLTDTNEISLELSTEQTAEENEATEQEAQPQDESHHDATNQVSSTSDVEAESADADADAVSTVANDAATLDPSDPGEAETPETVAVLVGDDAYMDFLTDTRENPVELFAEQMDEEDDEEQEMDHSTDESNVEMSDEIRV